MRHIEGHLMVRLEGWRSLSHEKVKFELNFERIRINQVKRG